MVDSLLTEEVRKVIYELPDLHKRFFVIGKDTLLPLAVLLVCLTIIGHDNHELWVFCRVVLGKLETFFHFGSEQVGNLFEVFEGVTHIAWPSATLSIQIPHLTPMEVKLLPFTVVNFSCQCGHLLHNQHPD